MGKLVGVEPEVVYPATVDLIHCALANRAPSWFVAGPNPFGDGRASERIAARLLRDVANISDTYEI